MTAAILDDADDRLSITGPLLMLLPNPLSDDELGILADANRL
jgi:hypothetical protein